MHNDKALLVGVLLQIRAQSDAALQLGVNVVISQGLPILRVLIPLRDATNALLNAVIIYDRPGAELSKQHLQHERHVREVEYQRVQLLNAKTNAETYGLFERYREVFERYLSTGARRLKELAIRVMSA